MFIFTDDEDIPPVDPGRVPVAPVLDLWGILPGDGAWFKPGPGGAGFDEPPPPMDRIREELARRKKKATKAPGGGGEDEAGRKKIENEADRKKIEDEAGRKKIAREAWLADLQSILRPKPLFTGSAVTTVQIDLGPLKGQAVKQGLPGSAAVPLALDDEPAEKRLSTPKASGDAPPKEKRPRVDDAKDPPSTAAAASAEPAKMGPPALVPLPGRPKAKPKAPAAEVVSAAEKRKQKEANALKLMPAAPKPPPAKRKRSNADSDDEPIFFLPRKKKGGSGGQAKLALVRGGHGRPGGGRLYRDSETDFDTDDLSDGSPDTTTSGGGGGCAGALLRGGGDGPVVLEDDDPLDFYGHQATEDAVRYQSRGVDTGKIPGPGAVRLDLEKLGRDMNLKKVTPAAIRAHPSSKVLHSEYADDFDEALKNVWVKDPSETPLIKGLPLVEEVVFFQVGNNIDPGNCYWRAVSHLGMQTASVPLPLWKIRDKADRTLIIQSMVYPNTVRAASLPKPAARGTRLTGEKGPVSKPSISTTSPKYWRTTNIPGGPGTWR